MPDNLERQGGTWHVRMAIPADVRQAFQNKKIFSKSLETGQRSEAMNRRLPYLAQWKADIEVVRSLARAPKEDWRPSLALSSANLQEQFNARFLNALAPQGAKKLPVPFESPLLAKLIGDGIPADITTLQRMAGTTRALIASFATHMHQLNPAESAEAHSIVLDHTVFKAKSPITPPRLAAFRVFREDRKVAAKTIDQQESKLDKLSAYLAETGKPLDFDCVSAWLDTLQVVSKTKTQYLLAGNVFWNWAIKHDLRWREEYKGAVSPFDKHELPQLRGKERAETKRLDFKMEDLSRLYEAADVKGLKALADLILLGVYTGARIEELCQLRTEHVITEDGVLCFDIADSKTEAGIRKVPIHPSLRDLVQRLSGKSEDGYLIQSNSRNKYENRSDLHSKAFGRLKTSLGFGPRHVFHSLRITAITQLIRADVPGTLVAELVGHETGLVTFDVYSRGASPQQKLIAISKLPALSPSR